jgi:hypothetical protein
MRTGQGAHLQHKVLRRLRIATSIYHTKAASQERAGSTEGREDKVSCWEAELRANLNGGSYQWGKEGGRVADEAGG